MTIRCWSFDNIEFQVSAMGYAGICINVKVMLNSEKRLTRTLGHGVTLHSLSKNNKKESRL